MTTEIEAEIEAIRALAVERGREIERLREQLRLCTVPDGWEAWRRDAEAEIERLTGLIHGRTLLPELTEKERENARLRAEIERLKANRGPGNLSEALDVEQEDLRRARAEIERLKEQLTASYGVTEVWQRETLAAQTEQGQAEARLAKETRRCADIADNAIRACITDEERDIATTIRNLILAPAALAAAKGGE